MVAYAARPRQHDHADPACARDEAALACSPEASILLPIREGSPMIDNPSRTERNELAAGQEAANDGCGVHAAASVGVSVGVPARAVLVVLLHPPEAAHAVR